MLLCCLPSFMTSSEYCVLIESCGSRKKIRNPDATLVIYCFVLQGLSMRNYDEF